MFIKEIEEWADRYTYERELVRIESESNPGVYRAMQEAGAAMALFDWQLGQLRGTPSKRMLTELDTEIREAWLALERPDYAEGEDLVLPSGDYRLFTDGKEIVE